MFSCVVGREGHCKQILLVCVGGACSVWTTLGLPQLMVVCVFLVYIAHAPGCSVGVLSKVVPSSLFILASSVCKSLQCLISALIQGGRAIYLGSLVQLCCGEGGTLHTNITGMCGECSQCLGHTGFAPAHGMCVLSWSTLLRLQVALLGTV